MACSTWSHLTSLRDLSGQVTVFIFCVISSRDWSADHNHSHLICETQSGKRVHQGTSCCGNKCHSTPSICSRKCIQLLKCTTNAEHHVSQQKGIYSTFTFSNPTNLDELRPEKEKKNQLPRKMS